LPAQLRAAMGARVPTWLSLRPLRSLPPELVSNSKKAKRRAGVALPLTKVAHDRVRTRHSQDDVNETRIIIARCALPFPPNPPHHGLSHGGHTDA
jgi:hypothetical protein